MKRTLRLAATGVAVIFASATVANAFQLETKGTSAKWRTDIVKKGNAYTACILGAWNKCEIAAGVSKTGTEGLDCDVSARPVTGNTATAGVINLTALNVAVAKCESKYSGTAAKVGLSALQPAGDPLINLKDIGCPGDCSTAEGSQPCANVEAWEAAGVDPANNSFKTALSLGVGLVPNTCAKDDCLPPGNTPQSSPCTRPGTKAVQFGTTVNNLAKGVIAYTSAVGACVQKCQDDLGTKAGGGFYDDGTLCNIPLTKNTIGPLNTTNPFQLCVSKARPGLAKATSPVLTPSCNPLNNFVGGLVDLAINNATNGNYDRVDLQTQYVLGLTDSANPFFTDSTNPFFTTFNTKVASLVGGLSDRTPAAGSRTSFGTTCATSNDGLLRDYEECDGTLPSGGNTLCGILPGTKAGACPTADDAIAGKATGRCPR